MASDKQLAVLLFTDIVGSVALQSKLGTEAYTRYITRHDSIFKHCLSYVEGASILNETGDGFLVKFGTASDAVETALRLQCLLREEVCEGEPMVLRIGLHMGEVSEMEEQITGETRAVGMAINLCARIMDLAADGQILLTRGVFDEARQYTREHPALRDFEAENLPPLQWPAHGRYIFKGTDEPMEIYEVGALGWVPLSPPEDSAKAKRAVSADEEATLGWRPGAGLPIPRHEKWVIVEKLGQGGFGEVWLAEHGDTKNQRVFKFCFDPEKLRSFKRELTLFRLLRDALGKRDDIAALYDVSVESPPFYLESEYVPTGNIGHWADSKGGIAKIDLRVRVDLMARIARALAAAHSVGIIHKDIKPSNILIHEAHGKPYPRIADFGIGTLSDSSNLLDHDITGAGFTESIIIESDGSGGSAGTQLYMAPEYLIGAPSSVRGDVFSLGVMLYQMVAGDLTKPMGTGWERDIEDPLLCEDIGRCVDIDPERRFEDANQLAEQLESLEERRGAKQREREAAEYKAQLKRQADKRRRLLALGGVALLGMLGVMGALYKGLQEQRQAMAEQMKLKEEQMQLKDQAKVMASQADYALANEHLKQGHANMAVAHLARALRSDPNNDAANRRLVATLTYNNFPRRLYPPLSLGALQIEEQTLPADVTWDGSHAAGTTANGGVEIFATATGDSQFGVLIERPGDVVEELRFNDSSDKLFVKRKRSYQVIDIANGSILADVDMRKERYGLSHELSMDGRYWIAEHFTEAQIHVHELYGDKKWLLADPKGASGNLVHYRASPDGRYLAAFWEASTSGYLSVCDLHEEQPAWKTLHEGFRWTGNSPDPVSDIDYVSQNIAFGNANGEIHVLDLVSGETVHTFITPRDFILGLRFSPGAAYLASGHFSHVARVWNLGTGELMSSPLQHQGAVGGLDYSDDGSRLLTASLDGQVRLWDPITGRQLSQPMPHRSQVLNAWFDDTETQALTLTLGGDASVWDLTNTPAYDAPLPYEGSVLAISPDHQRFVMRPPNQGMRQFEADGALHEHQPRSYPLNYRFRAYRGDDFVVGWMGRDGENVVSRLGSDGVTKEAPIADPKIKSPYTVVDYDASTGNFLGAVTSLNGQATSNTLELRNFNEPDEVLCKLEHRSTATAAALAPGGRYAVSTVRDQAFAWDMEENPPLPKKLGMSMVPTAIDIADGVPKAMVGTILGVAQLWDIATQQPLGGILRHDGPILLVDMNAEATIAITLSFPADQGLAVGEFRTWNLIDSTPITPPIPIATPPGFRFSARPDFRDGFVSLSEDGTHAIVCLGSESRRIDLHPQEGVTIPELADLAEGVAGFHIDEMTGGPVPLSQNDRSARLAKSSPADPVWKPWADWLQLNAGNRTISPGSDLTLEVYLEHLLGREDVSSFKRALSLSPNHPAALAGLGEAAMDGEASVEDQARAALYIKGALTQIEKQGIARQKGLEQAYGDIVEVSLKLGDIAEKAEDLETARKHYETALRAAIDGCESNFEWQEGQLALALAYTYNSHLVDGPQREAYLDAAILTMALLKAEGVTVEAQLDSATSQRWPDLTEGTPVIAPGSVWQYSQDQPVDDTWKDVNFDASAWSNGPGPLGYGDDFAKTVVEGKPQILYLRHTFTLKAATASKPWLLKILYDDGATVYLDGALVHEENIRQGKVPRVISSQDEGKYLEREVSIPRLAPGPHTFAISVHQEKPTSSDLTIDLAAFPDGETVGSRLRAVDSSTIDRIVEQLGDQVPSTWAEHWHFYHAPVADAASPLAVSPSAFYRRALVQESRHRFKDAEAAAHVVIRMSADDTDTQWVDKAEAIVERLRFVNEP